MTNHISENYSDITPMLNQEVLGFVEVRGVRFILMGAIKDNAHLRTSDDVGWFDPNELAKLWNKPERNGKSKEV